METSDIIKTHFTGDAQTYLLENKSVVQDALNRESAAGHAINDESFVCNCCKYLLELKTFRFQTAYKQEQARSSCTEQAFYANYWASTISLCGTEVVIMDIYKVCDTPEFMDKEFGYTAYEIVHGAASDATKKCVLELLGVHSDGTSDSTLAPTTTLAPASTLAEPTSVEASDSTPVQGAPNDTAISDILTGLVSADSLRKSVLQEYCMDVYRQVMAIAGPYFVTNSMQGVNCMAVQMAVDGRALAELQRMFSEQFFKFTYTNGTITLECQPGTWYDFTRVLDEDELSTLMKACNSEDYTGDFFFAVADCYLNYLLPNQLKLAVADVAEALKGVKLEDNYVMVKKGQFSTATFERLFNELKGLGYTVTPCDKSYRLAW